MAMSPDLLEKHLRDTFPDAKIRLTDLAGDQDHWQAEIVSEHFRGKTRLAQHRLVYDALGARMGGELHALSLKTGVPPS